MPFKRFGRKPKEEPGTERLADLASNQVIRSVPLSQDSDTILPEARELSEEEKQADVVPKDFESFDLDAVSKLELTKENQTKPEE